MTIGYCFHYPFGSLTIASSPSSHWKLSPSLFLLSSPSSTLSIASSSLFELPNSKPIAMSLALKDPSIVELLNLHSLHLHLLFLLLASSRWKECWMNVLIPHLFTIHVSSHLLTNYSVYIYIYVYH